LKIFFVLINKAHEALLGGFEGKNLRRIYGAEQIDGVWRRRYNKELYSLFNDVDIIKRIKIDHYKERKSRNYKKDLRNLGMVNWKEKPQERGGWRSF
jgi:hypothetical protein